MSPGVLGPCDLFLCVWILTVFKITLSLWCRRAVGSAKTVVLGYVFIIVSIIISWGLLENRYTVFPGKNVTMYLCGFK